MDMDLQKVTATKSTYTVTKPDYEKYRDNPVNEKELKKIAESLGENSNLKLVRKILKLMRLISTNPDSEFKIGDAVFDRKNQEFGIVLFKKPRELYKDTKEKWLVEDKMESTVFVVLTISLSDQNEQKLTFRVRYTPAAFLQLMKDVDNPISFDKNTDLNFFCNNQCILICSEECALYKHSQKVNLKNDDDEI